MVLQAVALVRYGDALTWSGLPAVGYVAVLAAIGVVAAWILVATGRRSA